MKLSKALIGVLFLTTFFAGAVAVEAGRFGRHHRPSGMMGSEFRTLKAIIQLDLSDSQKSKITSIIEKYENERAGLKESLREARKNLTRVLEAEPADEAQIRSALRREAPIREKLFVQRVKMAAELKTVLSPEQLQLLEQGKAHRLKRR